jgi:hypothetical protein
VGTKFSNTTSFSRNKASSFCVFFWTKIYSKYIKNIGIKLVSLKNIFQYKSNDTNFTQYIQVLVALFVRSNFALKCACALFLEKEVVIKMAICIPIVYRGKVPFWKKEANAKK